MMVFLYGFFGTCVAVAVLIMVYTTGYKDGYEQGKEDFY